MATQNGKRVFVCGVGMTKVSTFTRFTTAHILHPTNILESFQNFLCEYIKLTNPLVLALCLFTETYSEPCQISKKELFAEMAHGIKLLSIFAKRSTLDIMIRF